MTVKEKPHYVNNAEFSSAVVEYVERVNEARDANKQIPIVPNYIATCFMKIAEGLSFKSNFSRYTYREEMVMDAVENCLKAILNYDIEAATRTGKPNAFAYFTQISWYAFLRRIAKEKKQQDIKMKFITESGLEDFLIDPKEDPEAAKAVQGFVEVLRQRMDEFADLDSDPILPRKRARRIANSVDSDLAIFFEDEEEDE